MKCRAMRRVIAVLALLLAWHAAGPGRAQNMADTPEVAQLHSRVTSFFSAVSNQETARRAVEDLLKGGPLERNANTPKLVEQAEQLTSRFGLYVESERVTLKQVGRDLVLMTYVYKTEQFPVVWRFAFYRPPNRDAESTGWRAVAVSFDTNYKLLELSAE